MLPNLQTLEFNVPRTEYHYWLVSRDSTTGQPYLIYGGISESIARQRGLEMLGGLDFRIKRFPTKSLSAASAMLRGTRLNKGMGLHESTRRQGHEKTLRRRQARKQRLTRW